MVFAGACHGLTDQQMPEIWYKTYCRLVEIINELCFVCTHIVVTMHGGRTLLNRDNPRIT